MILKFSGTYSNAVMKLKLKRRLSYHLLRTYLPSIFFVTIAWCSMFVPLNHVPGNLKLETIKRFSFINISYFKLLKPISSSYTISFPGRVMMGMTTLLTLSSSFASLATVTPPISYTTRLDIWMVTCIVFVFLTMAEFTLVIILKYYLVNHIPVFCFQYLVRRPPENVSSQDKKEEKENTNFIEEFLVRNVERASATSTIELTEDMSEYDSNHSTEEFPHFYKRKNNTVSRKDNQEELSSPVKLKCINEGTSDDQYLNEEKERISQYIIRLIEKYSVFVYLLAFLTFNVVYWRDIHFISKEVKRQFDHNNFNSSA